MKLVARPLEEFEIRQSYEQRLYVGTGDAKSICLLIREHGIGDDIHSMPVIQWLTDNGFDVTVYAQTFTRKCWESCGAKFFDINETGLGWISDNEHRFGKIYSLSQWSIWEQSLFGNHKDTIRSFADLIGADIPKSFSWIDKLRPARVKSRVIYAPESFDKWRKMLYWKQVLVYFLLILRYGGATWLGSSFFAYKAKSFDELIALIYSAKKVVGINTGITNVASVLGVPTVAMFGFTGSKHIIEQVKDLTNDYKVTVLKGVNGNQCVAPCYGYASYGFYNGKCCGEFDYPKCLHQIPIKEILFN